ncbi:helix-turn-helix domain-containing protein [Dyadobacter crusticola]|uniref:helix-turn-helix domain-containing protein n=1 Tax=Dyadobacter crusticola TaxID=292407 RepID=UPI0004E1D2B4|nr:helix-turn-helix transcriptional regulator [Dyadobacter crusticola]
MNILASNLLAKREEKRYTQTWVATKCGMSQPNYSDIERGKTTPSIWQLKKFAEVFEATVDELLRDRSVNETESTNPKLSGTKNILTEEDKDMYIRMLKDKLRTLLVENEKKN